MRRDETFIVFNFDTIWTRYSNTEDGLFCLSERDVALLLDVLRPAHWPSRWVGDVSGVGGDEYRRALLRNNGRFEDLETALSFIERLEHKLMTSCSDALLQGLEAIAAAIAGQDYKSVITQNCGGGSGACSGGSVDLSDGESLQPGEVITEVPNEPPTGFESWEDYKQYKCEAANFLFDWFTGSLRGLSGISGLYGILAITGPIVIGMLVPTVVLGPIAFVVLIAAIIAMAGLGLAGFVQFAAIADGLDENRGEVVCRLYQAGNTTAAIDAIIDEVEVIMVGLGITGPLDELILGVINAMIPNEVMNRLFQLYADVNYVGADCSSCDSLECGESVIGPYEQITVDVTREGDILTITSQSFYDVNTDKSLSGYTYDTTNFPECTCNYILDITFLSNDPGSTPISVNWFDCNGAYHGDTIPYGNIQLPFGCRGMWFGLQGNVTYSVEWSVAQTEP